MQLPDQIIALGLPTLAGASFAATGIAYQAALKRQVIPIRLMTLLAFVGTAFFTVRCGATGLGDARGILLGIAAGLGQYLTVRLMGRAIKLGPFSPVWCVVSLYFAPVALYAALVQQLHQEPGQWIAILAAICCCIVAASGAQQRNTEHQPVRLTYALLLVLILFLNSIPNICIQDHGNSSTPLAPFFLAMYAAILLATVIDAVIAADLLDSVRRAWLPGLLAGAGSISGMLAMGASPARPSTFLISSMVTLLLPMLAAVLFYGERASARWLATIALGLAAIACSTK